MAGELTRLVRRCIEGDEQARTELVERYSPSALGAASAVLHDWHAAEDVVQEAFMRALSRLHMLRDAECFEGWLQEIVRRRAFRLLDKRKRRTALLGRNLGRPRPEPSAAERAEQEDLRRIVRAAVAALPPTKRTIYEEVYVSGRSFREVAKRLGIPAGTSKSRHYDLKKHLRMLLGSLDGSP